MTHLVVVEDYERKSTVIME